MALARFLRDHSLSLTLLAVGCLVLATACLSLESGKAWDVTSGIGLGFLLVGGVNLLSGPLRERFKPDT